MWLKSMKYSKAGYFFFRFVFFSLCSFQMISWNETKAHTSMKLFRTRDFILMKLNPCKQVILSFSFLYFFFLFHLFNATSKLILWYRRFFFRSFHSLYFIINKWYTLYHVENTFLTSFHRTKTKIIFFLNEKCQIH